MRIIKWVTTVSLVIILIFTGIETHAQTATAVQCGSVVEGELLEDGNKEQVYSISLAAGDTLNFQAVPIGQTLDLTVDIYTPTHEHLSWIMPNNRTTYNDSTGDGGTEEGTTPVLSARGIYTIEVEGNNSNDIGSYTLNIGCILRDGTIVLPGDTPPINNTAAVGSNTAITAPPAFSGVGFPGLAAVDFSNVAKIPMIANAPMSGAVTATGGEILGFTFDANAGNTVDLSFTRLSGNLNLGMVVLSAENQVVFQASLVTSQSLNTRFTLPSGGQYTIGVFRIDLLPPALAEATAYTIQASVN
ncbi:MAG: hypothetical protein H6672_17400 [Anaerolineaceae bacterium]|nr:hypothetical protein [Anaerolineaceae bacterium]